MGVITGSSDFQIERKEVVDSLLKTPDNYEIAPTTFSSLLKLLRFVKKLPRYQMCLNVKSVPLLHLFNRHEELL